MYSLTEADLYEVSPNRKKQKQNSEAIALRPQNLQPDI